MLLIADGTSAFPIPEDEWKPWRGILHPRLSGRHLANKSVHSEDGAPIAPLCMT